MVVGQCPDFGEGLRLPFWGMCLVRLGLPLPGAKAEKWSRLGVPVFCPFVVLQFSHQPARQREKLFAGLRIEDLLEAENCLGRNKQFNQYLVFRHWARFCLFRGELVFFVFFFFFFFFFFWGGGGGGVGGLGTCGSFLREKSRDVLGSGSLAWAAEVS